MEGGGFRLRSPVVENSPVKAYEPLRELNCMYEIGLLCIEQTEGLLYIPRRPHLTLFRHSSMRALGSSRCSTSRL